jgi:hypothetical protein
MPNIEIPDEFFHQAVQTVSEAAMKHDVPASVIIDNWSNSMLGFMGGGLSSSVKTVTGLIATVAQLACDEALMGHLEYHINNSVRHGEPIRKNALWVLAYYHGIAEDLRSHIVDYAIYLHAKELHNG